jgi:hypothetical protein
MSKRLTKEEIQAGWDDFDRPGDGDIYEHYKGGRYEIVATGFLEDSEVPCVIYRSLEKDVVWVRTAKNYRALMKSTWCDGTTLYELSSLS